MREAQDERCAVAEGDVAAGGISEGRAALAECLELLRRGNGTAHFCLLRERTIDQSCIDGDDIDLLGSPRSVAALLSHLQQLALQGRCHFRVSRSGSGDKTRLSVFSRDMLHRVDFDLWTHLWQIDRGKKCLRFSDVSHLIAADSKNAAFARLRMDVECCIYIHHLASKKKDLASRSVQDRLAFYEQNVRHCPGPLQRVVQEIRAKRRIDRSALRTTAKVIRTQARGQGIAVQATRRLSKHAQRWTAPAGRKHPSRAMALIGCDGCGKTSIAEEIAARSGGEVEFLTGKQLYRLSLPFRAAYKFRRTILHISAERLDEWLAPLAYACAAAGLRRRLKRHPADPAASGAPMLLIDRSPADFLYVGRKTSHPRFSIWRRILSPWTASVPVVHFAVPYDVLCQRKQEINRDGHARYDADMLRHYLSRRYVDYTVFCNDSSLADAVSALTTYIERRGAAGSERPKSDVDDSKASSWQRVASVAKRLCTPIDGAWGVRSFMWAIFAYLVYESVKRTPTIGMLVGMVATGLALQMAMYLLSHRPAIKRGRSLARLRSIVAGGVTISLGLIFVVGAILYDGHVRRMNQQDKIEAIMATCVAAWLLASSFDMRVKLLKMNLRSRGWSDTARAATRLLLPIGPYQYHRLLDRLQSAIADADGGQRDGRGLRQVLDECRVRCDSRYARPVPWAGACRIVAAYAALRNAGADSSAQRIAFDREEILEDVPVQASLICGLADLLLDAGGASHVRIRSISRANGALAVQVGGRTTGDLSSPEMARELNAALSRGVCVDQTSSSARTTFELTFPATTTDESFKWNDALAEYETSLAQSRYSRDAKQSFRRNGQVVRMQRDDVHDSKPTRLEDEYLILRRMRDVSPGFPQLTGFGTMPNGSWLSYRFREGQPVLDWLKLGEHRRQWFRIIADVDHLVRCLRDNAVAHRDLNPTNLIVGVDGRVGLIDFDQAVADDPTFASADTDGGQRGLVTNDIVKLIEKCGLAAAANDAIERLNAIWPSDAPHELEFAGHVFAGRLPWFAEWSPIADAVGNLSGRRALVITAGAPLMSVFFASNGAKVHVVGDPRCETLIGELARAADVSVRQASLDDLDPHAFDLVVCAGPDLSDAEMAILQKISTTQRQVLFEHCSGSIDDARRRVGDLGLIWRGVAGYSPRLNPLIVAAHADHLADAQWLKVKHA